VVAEDGFDTFLHLPCRLVGEGEGQDLKGVGALMQELGDAVGEHSCFPTSCSCHNHHRTLGTEHGLALWLVECIEVGHEGWIGLPEAELPAKLGDVRA